METNEISFENLPKAVAHLLSEVAEIKLLVEKSRPSAPTSKHIPIGIDEACAIIAKAKPTVYALVRKRLIPCYKNGKKLYFFEDELLAWIESGRKKTVTEINQQAKEFVAGKRAVNTHF